MELKNDLILRAARGEKTERSLSDDRWMVIVAKET